MLLIAQATLLLCTQLSRAIDIEHLVEDDELKGDDVVHGIETAGNISKSSSGYGPDGSVVVPEEAAIEDGDARPTRIHSDSGSTGGSSVLETNGGSRGPGITMQLATQRLLDEGGWVGMKKGNLSDSEWELKKRIPIAGIPVDVDRGPNALTRILAAGANHNSMVIKSMMDGQTSVHLLNDDDDLLTGDKEIIANPNEVLKDTIPGATEEDVRLGWPVL